MLLLKGIIYSLQRNISNKKKCYVVSVIVVHVYDVVSCNNWMVLLEAFIRNSLLREYSKLRICNPSFLQ